MVVDAVQIEPVCVEKFPSRAKTGKSIDLIPHFE